MKVNGTGQGPAGEIPGAQPGDKAASTAEGGAAPGAEKSGQAFAEKLSGAVAAKPIDPAARAQRSAPASPSSTSQLDSRGVREVPVNDLAAALRAGTLTPHAAVEKVVDRVVARQLGPDAPAEMRERVRLALQDALESDPLLTEKLNRLG